MEINSLINSLKNEIKELKQEVLELKLSSGIYIETLNSSVDAIVRYDEIGRVEYLNPAFTKMFGWTFEELVGNRVDFVPLEVMEETKKAIERIRAGEKITNFQTRRRTKDGRILDVAMSVASIYDYSGFNLGNVVILRDETQRRKIENELQKSRDQYTQLLNASVDAIVRYNAEGKVEYLNPAFTRLFGWTFKELKGRRVDFVPASALEATIDATKRIKKGEKITNFLTQRFTKDGRILDVAMSVASIYDDDGNNIGNVVIIRDETERKNVKIALEEAINMGKSANKFKSDFLANMNHEIRPSMDKINGMTRLMLDTDLNDEQAEYMKKIQDSSDALLNIIKDILDFSKIETGKLE